jgi:hypothetical protein
MVCRRLAAAVLQHHVAVCALPGTQQSVPAVMTCPGERLTGKRLSQIWQHIDE